MYEILTIWSFLVAQDIDNNDDKEQFDRYNIDDYMGLAKGWISIKLW